MPVAELGEDRAVAAEEAESGDAAAAAAAEASLDAVRGGVARFAPLLALPRGADGVRKCTSKSDDARSSRVTFDGGDKRSFAPVKLLLLLLLAIDAEVEVAPLAVPVVLPRLMRRALSLRNVVTSSSAA